MRRQKKVPEHFARDILVVTIVLKDFPNGKKVSQGLGHLLLIDLHKAIMDPIPGEFLTGCGGGLRNFIFMMRKDEIRPAPMDIKRLAQMPHRHGGTGAGPGALLSCASRCCTLRAMRALDDWLKEQPTH